MIKVQHTQLESSTIDMTSYYADTKEFIVTFKSGAVYSYHEVAADDYRKFINSTSAGQALNHFIKSNYQFTKVEQDGE
jgi:hypothetical protein